LRKTVEHARPDDTTAGHHRGESGDRIDTVPARFSSVLPVSPEEKQSLLRQARERWQAGHLPFRSDEELQRTVEPDGRL
jgi:hypothetical protein